MRKLSAGILIFRNKNGQLEVLLAHHGGPFWAKKDDGAWSIIKGEYNEDEEEPFEAAKREFKEETTHNAPDGNYIELGEFKRKDGKTTKAWAVEADFDAKTIKSNTFEMEWPPKSGKLQEFPENDRAEWFAIEQALPKLHSGQQIFLERLAAELSLEKPEAEEPRQATLF